VELAVYLGTGILSDLLVTAYYLFVARGLALPAALASIPIALLNFWVLNRVLVVDPSWYGAVAYAVGNAAGCFAIMRVSKLLKGKI
jgi:hypothetical protein